MSALQPVRSRRGRRRFALAPRLMAWLVDAVAIYWTLLVARWCLWVIARVTGETQGLLGELHRLLAWPFVLLPGTARWPFLADLAAIAASSVMVLGISGILAGWIREGRRGV